MDLGLLDSEPHIAHEFLAETKPEYTPGQLEPYDVVISLKPRVSAASVQGLERLCAIGRCGVGYDNVDIAACTARDIAVYITPEGVVRPMASSIVLFVLALSHNLVRKDRLVRQGEWVPSTRLFGREPRGRTIGTIGFGNIAREAVRLLKFFDVSRFLGVDPFVSTETAAAFGVEMTTLDELLRSSHYVLVNCPLNSSTRGLIGERELRLMRPDAVLINTARGPIVDELALMRALREGWIRGAALDVFEQEPLDPDSPLLKMENVIVTSHSVGWTEELFRDMVRIDCEGAIALSRGDLPRSIVNREVLERPGFQHKLKRHREAFYERRPQR
jgi:phosphoglycerate dehydrogenase-like enzyme